MPSKKIERFYNSKAWRRMSRYIRLRDHGVCQECGRAGNEVHHIIPITENNVHEYEKISLNPENLQLLCTECHNAKRNSGVIREDMKFDDDGNIIGRK